MTWLEFTASIVKSLAWPGFLFASLMFLRDPILQVLSRLQKLKFKEIEADFNRELDEIEQDAKAAGLETIEDIELVEDIEDNLRQISTVSPNASIVEAFRMIETSSRNLISTKNDTVDYSVKSPYRLIERILSGNDLLEKREIKIFRDLRQLRNKIVHTDFVANKKQADDYIELAALLIGKLDDAANQQDE